MIDRAVVYGRVSYDDRDNESRNLNNQLDMGRAYCQERGYQVVEELSEDDRGASGAEIDLPALNQIREMARRGDMSVLVVREIDRLSRNLAKQLIVEAELKRYGVRIEYVLGDYPDTPEGNLMKHVRASIAEFEREKINERMTRGRRVKVDKAGSIIANDKSLYGYRLDTEVKEKKEIFCRLEVYEPEAQVIRLIFTWYTEGGRVPVTEIARRLTEMGVPTPTDGDGHGRRAFNRKRPAGHWSAGSVQHILKNVVYATGQWRYGKAYRENEKWKRRPLETCPSVKITPIITPELWAAAEERKKQNKRESGPVCKHDYLLSRRVICAQCRHAVSGQAQGQRLYYCCKGREAVTHCRSRKWRVEVIDQHVWEWIKELMQNPDTLLEKMRDAQAERKAANAHWLDQLAVTDGVIAKQRAQLDRANERYIKGKMTSEVLDKWEKDVEANIKSLQVERAKLEAKLSSRLITAAQFETVREFAQDVKSRIPYADEHFAERRRLIDALNVTAKLAWEEEGWVIYVMCEIGDVRLSIVPTKASFSLSAGAPLRSS